MRDMCIVGNRLQMLAAWGVLAAAEVVDVKARPRPQAWLLAAEVQG